MRPLILVHRAVPLLGEFGRVHSSVANDPIVGGRHRSFVVTHFVGGAVALAGLVAYLVVADGTDLFFVSALAWLSLAIPIAVFLSWTGRLETAHLLSAMNLAGIVTFVAAHTGGVASFALPWLAVVPVETALSSSRRVAVAALILSLGALAGLYGAAAGGWLPPPRTGFLAAPAMPMVGIASAVLYVGMFVIAAQHLARRSERVARDGERRYRLLAENATDLISLHRADGSAVFVSHGARRLFARDPGDLLGDGFAASVAAEDRPGFHAALAGAARDGRECAIEFRFVGEGQSCQPTWVEARCRPIMDQREAALGGGVIVAITRDISDRRAREEELKRARDEAESASRTKSRFLASISHELRTPLNAIIGFADVLSTGLDAGADRKREYAALIGESGRHLLHVVNDLLDMSRIDAGEYRIYPEHFALVETVRYCAEIVRSSGEERDVTVVVEDPDSVPEIVADRRAVRQILLNLLSNAVKFSHLGGTVRVGVALDDQGVALYVADDGVGFDESILSRLGEPFVQGEDSYDRSYDGAGLGLSVVKGLVELHGGTLAVDSARGCGTCVTVHLPQSVLRAEVQQPPAPALERRPTKIPG